LLRRKPRSAIRNGLAIVAAALGVAVCAAPSALASEPLSDKNAGSATLAVNAKGEALVSYRRAGGGARHVLVWGAINSLTPDSGQPQVHFKYDYAGGWGKYRRLVWPTFRNACAPYDGPALVYLVAACKAPDGSYWALQRWQRGLPLLGFKSWLPSQREWELHLSHWSGSLPRLEVSTNWTYGHRWIGLFGRLTYAGRAVHGLGSTSLGNPTDRYGRNVYIDTFNSAYGPGWRRESGILVHRPAGTFCHSFVPQRPFPGYPSSAIRPAAPGKLFRITVMGPGVTPVIQWRGKGLGKYKAGDAADRVEDRRSNELFDAWLTGDKRCAPER
jgi:hypothetical protein